MYIFQKFSQNLFKLRKFAAESGCDSCPPQRVGTVLGQEQGLPIAIVNVCEET